MPTRPEPSTRGNENPRRASTTQSAQTATKTTNIRLTNYDGTTDYAVYRIQFGVTARRLGWTEEDKCFELTQRLAGKATETVAEMALHNPDYTYAQLDTALSKRFAKTSIPAQAQQELAKLAQAEGQTLADFAHQVEVTGRRFMGPTTDAHLQPLLFGAFVDGIRDREIATWLQGVTTKTLETALNFGSNFRPTTSAKRIKVASVTTTATSDNLEQRYPQRTLVNVNLTKPSPNRDYGQNPNHTVVPQQEKPRQYEENRPRRGRPYGSKRKTTNSAGRGGKTKISFFTCGKDHRLSECREYAEFRRQRPLSKTAITWYDQQPPFQPNPWYNAHSWVNPNQGNVALAPPPPPPYQPAILGPVTNATATTKRQSPTGRDNVMPCVPVHNTNNLQGY